MSDIDRDRALAWLDAECERDYFGQQDAINLRAYIRKDAEEIEHLRDDIEKTAALLYGIIDRQTEEIERLRMAREVLIYQSLVNYQGQRWILEPEAAAQQCDKRAAIYREQGHSSALAQEAEACATVIRKMACLARGGEG